MDWTKEQKQAIEEKGNNILVAAAAGSGKTAVLVERIINKVVNQNIDIDKILIVTFTNAAASEMRERILEAIYKKLEEEPNNINLQKQITLLNKASICTIHSFCLEVIRNNFFEIDVSANFRIGDSAEIELLKNDTLEEILENEYLEADEGFLKLTETYTTYKNDDKLKEIILNIYRYIQSNPFPLRWLQEKIEEFNIDDNLDFAETTWGKIILEHAKEEIKQCMIRLEKLRKDTLKFPELEPCSMLLEQDINNLANIFQNSNSWESMYTNMNQDIWEDWPRKKLGNSFKDEAKEIRNKIKKDYNNIRIIYNSQEAIKDIKSMYPILKELQKLVEAFSNLFHEKKKEKNIIDFNDIEHFALNILVKENEGKLEPTEVAKKYKEKFEEIAVDEYQDSNYVQEYILNSISNGNNIFMVGDVKQSIYKFRQASPELFLKKYETYQLKTEKPIENGQKIQLFKNFRSRQNVLDITNCIFENIMSKTIGDVEYNEEEFLNYGANYPEPEEKSASFAGIAELNIIDLTEDDEENIYVNDEEEETENSEEESEEKIENTVLEARFVAKKVKQLVESDYMVYDRKKGYRKITYKDICILLRAATKMSPIYEKEIEELGIPVFSDTSATYLESMEVQTIMALLKIIDNPMQDIPLVTILRSNIGGFNDNELIQIRLIDKNNSFYEAMIKARLSVEKNLSEKIENLLERLEQWRKEEKYLSLDELIWKIYMETGFYHYVSLLPNGNLRQANLKLLFEKAKQYEKASFKGLFNFINFIDKVKASSSDTGSAKLIGENDDVVRIMSIHKSKGLEFPVVFLCHTGKQFNLQDLRSPILLHQTMGLGAKYIDSERKIGYDTLSKEALKLAIKRENISEEMRVLYVALTRAKEKLIITGIDKNLEESWKEKQKQIELYKESQVDPNKLNYQLIEKYISYLDWLELVYLYNEPKIKSMIELQTYKKADIMNEIKEEDTQRVDLKEIMQEEAKKIDKEEKVKLEEKISRLLEWKYGYIASTNLPTKTSVTKLKQINEMPEETIVDIEELISQKPKETKIKVELTDVPNFTKETQKLTPMQKGTLMHLCVQKLDEKKNYSEKDLQQFIQELYENNIITELEQKSIDIQILKRYVDSNIYNELQTAKEIQKEKPFYINIPARNINPEAEETETILVQGIIDLYYINQKDELILVDFKTDHIKPGQEKMLEEKYKLQLDLYSQALEKALGRKVNKALIYSLT